MLIKVNLDSLYGFNMAHRVKKISKATPLDNSGQAHERIWVKNGRSLWINSGWDGAWMDKLKKPAHLTRNGVIHGRQNVE